MWYGLLAQVIPYGFFDFRVYLMFRVECYCEWKCCCLDKCSDNCVFLTRDSFLCYLLVNLLLSLGTITMWQMQDWPNMWREEMQMVYSLLV